MSHCLKLNEIEEKRSDAIDKVRSILKEYSCTFDGLLSRTGLTEEELRSTLTLLDKLEVEFTTPKDTISIENIEYIKYVGLHISIGNRTFGKVKKVSEPFIVQRRYKQYYHITNTKIYGFIEEPELLYKESMEGLISEYGLKKLGVDPKVGINFVGTYGINIYKKWYDEKGSHTKLIGKSDDR